MRMHRMMAVLVALAIGAVVAAQSAEFAEMVRNGQFDAPGEPLAAWSYVSEGGADGSMELETAEPQDAATPNSIKLSALSLGQRCGFANAGVGGGMKVEKDTWYDATFYARTTSGGARAGRGGGAGSGGTVGLVFSLESPDGNQVCARTTLPEIGGGWRQYRVSLHAYDSLPAARLVISPIEPTIIWLDDISLTQRNPADNPEAEDGPQVNAQQPQPVLLEATADAPLAAMTRVIGAAASEAEMTQLTSN